METKYAVVTGANRGIGFEISRELCFAGFTVYMCGRNSARIQQAAGMLKGEGHKVEAVTLDVSKNDDIEKFATRLVADKIQLSAIVNNAAVLHDNEFDILDIPYDLALQTIQTNTLAPLYFTRAMLPLLAAGARVVMMSSGAGAVTGTVRNWSPIYSMTKTALNSITRHLAPELEKRGITVSAATPGWTKTDMGGAAATRSVKEGAETPVWLATKVGIEETGHFWRDKKIIPW